MATIAVSFVVAAINYFINLNQLLEEYTVSQLASRNGQDRDEIWIAYKGIIYDVTESKMWREGMHYGNLAGQDLTEEFEKSPHGEYVFNRYKAIGKLIVQKRST